MNDRIVYFLGAGFSAPLGLPVMTNFLIKSKDLYFSDQQKYAHFQRVFDTLDGMAKAKNYYSVDLFNIEEVLSLLEMEDYVGSSTHKSVYINYLRDVILALTPEFSSKGQAWDPPLFSADLGPADYTSFLASLFGIDWVRRDGATGYSAIRPFNRPRYSIVTLNYDLVLESALNLLTSQLGKLPIGFAQTSEEAEDASLIPIAKLHGSVEPPTIVPPTWNKVGNDEVREAWRLAYRLLAEATEIRFLGYSLPLTDTYVRYLLGSSVLKSKHLKKIDVVCLDDLRSSVRNRFAALLTFYRFRFVSGDISKYLGENRRAVEKLVVRQGDQVARVFDKLEDQHERFMELEGKGNEKF